MAEITVFCILVVAGIFASACSQLLLKRKEINITAMSRGVNLKDMPILEFLGYVIVPLLLYIVLKEKLTKRTIISILLILIGIVWFYQ